MGKTTLVEADIRYGEDLLALLDEAGYPLVSALWAYVPDRYADWRLVIATPLFQSEGPLAAYRKLDSVVRRARPDLVLFLQQVQLVSPEEPLIRSLRKTYPAGSEIANPLISGSTANTNFEEGYLYRVHGTTE